MLLGFQGAAPETILKDMVRLLEQAQTITVTRIETTEEFPKESRTAFYFRRGGYFRAEAGNVVDITNPKQGWTYDVGRKIYQKRPHATVDPLSELGLGFLRTGLPVVGKAAATKWHNHSTLRIELKTLTLRKRQAKLFIFVDPKTHLPVGVSANLGSVTQVRIFEKLLLDRKIDPKAFTFAPPKGWKEVTATTGGWD